VNIQNKLYDNFNSGDAVSIEDGVEIKFFKLRDLRKLIKTWRLNFREGRTNNTWERSKRFEVRMRKLSKWLEDKVGCAFSKIVDNIVAVNARITWAPHEGNCVIERLGLKIINAYCK